MEWKKLGNMPSLGCKLTLPGKYKELFLVVKLAMPNNEVLLMTLYLIGVITTTIKPATGFYNASTWAGYVRFTADAQEIILLEAANGIKIGSAVSGENLDMEIKSASVNSIAFFKVGKIIFANLASWHTINDITIPENFRPMYDCYFVVEGTGDKKVLMKFLPGGVMETYEQYPNIINIGVIFSVCYLAAS